MKIPFSISDEENLTLISFLSDNKNFQYFSIDDLLKINEKKLIFINKNSKKKSINEILETFKLHDAYFFYHISNKEFFLEKNFKAFSYPINPLTIQKIFLNKDTFVFSNIELQHNNLILNKTTGKKTYLTETEASIFKLLLIEKNINREILKKKILNIKTDIETKSLESHLSRIRKKIKEVDPLIEITSQDSKQIILKN